MTPIIIVKLRLQRRDTSGGHDYKLFLNYSRLNVRKYFFSEIIAAIGNNLERNIIKLTNSKHCKMSLLSCDITGYPREILELLLC